MMNNSPIEQKKRAAADAVNVAMKA